MIVGRQTRHEWWKMFWAHMPMCRWTCLNSFSPPQLFVSWWPQLQSWPHWFMWANASWSHQSDASGFVYVYMKMKTGFIWMSRVMFIGSFWSCKFLHHTKLVYVWKLFTERSRPQNVVMITNFSVLFLKSVFSCRVCRSVKHAGFSLCRSLQLEYDLFLVSKVVSSGPHAVWTTYT